MCTLALAGLVLLGCILQAELLIAPRAVEALGRTIYRVAFYVLLPWRGVVIVAIPEQNHQYAWYHTIPPALFAPFGYYAIFVAWSSLRRFLRDRRPSGAGLSRREFIEHCAITSGAAIVGGTGAYGALIAPQRLRIERYEMPIKGLPLGLDGLRIAHLSDLHYGPFTSLAYIERALRDVNAEEPDLALLTGDYVHRSTAAIEPGIEVLRLLRARHGAAAVLGNHDHWEDAEACRRVFQRFGIPLLDNQRCWLTTEGLTREPASLGLCLAGVGDLWEDRVDFDAALNGVHEETPRVVLAHNPDTAERRHRHRMDLMLSGHTHGGQVRLLCVGTPLLPSSYGQKYAGGLVHGPACPVIVSRAIGMAMFPIRLGVPPEFSIITLRSA